MKKKEFLMELRQSIKGLPKDEIEEKVEFYSEMIDDYMEDGLSEEEAVYKVGGVDDAVKNVAKETSFAKIVKHKASNIKKPSGLMILFLILGFPLWFPLFMVLLVMCLVACILLWILPIVTIAVTAALFGSTGACAVAAFGNLTGGSMGYACLFGGGAMVTLGLAILMIFVVIASCKVAALLNKKVFTGIKVAFIGRGGKND